MRNTLRLGWALLIVAFGVVATMRNAEPGFDDGVDAFYRGDFAVAMANWRPLAEAGDPRSQFNVGLLYERGQGVERDEREAARWYLRAANQGYGLAQHHLGRLYAERRGVPDDPVEAYVWLTLAERTLGTGGTARVIALERDRVVRRMTAEQRERAEAALLVWRPVRE